MAGRGAKGRKWITRIARIEQEENPERALRVAIELRSALAEVACGGDPVCWNEQDRDGVRQIGQEVARVVLHCARDGQHRTSRELLESMRMLALEAVRRGDEDTASWLLDRLHLFALGALENRVESLTSQVILCLREVAFRAIQKSLIVTQLVTISHIRLLGTLAAQELCNGLFRECGSAMSDTARHLFRHSDASSRVVIPLVQALIDMAGRGIRVGFWPESEALLAVVEELHQASTFLRRGLQNNENSLPFRELAQSAIHCHGYGVARIIYDRLLDGIRLQLMEGKEVKEAGWLSGVCEGVAILCTQHEFGEIPNLTLGLASLGGLLVDQELRGTRPYASTRIPGPIRRRMLRNMILTLVRCLRTGVGQGNDAGFIALVDELSKRWPAQVCVEEQETVDRFGMLFVSIARKTPNEDCDQVMSKVATGCGLARS